VKRDDKNTMLDTFIFWRTFINQLTKRKRTLRSKLILHLVYDLNQSVAYAENFHGGASKCQNFSLH